MNKYEQLIDLIINENEDKARELFHQIVVEKSREIYESLVDESDLDTLGGNQVDELAQQVSDDEISMESDDEFDVAAPGGEEGGEDEPQARDEFGGEEGGFGDEEGGEGSVEDRVQDLESALDDLKAEFDALMGGNGGEEPAAELPADGAEGDEAPAPAADEQMFEEEEEDEEEDEDGKVEESRQSRKMTEAEWIREYVEKVGEVYQQEPAKGEGKEVGNGGSTTVGTKSPGLDKDPGFGGNAKNIANGKAEANPTGPVKKTGGLLKQGGELIGKVQNSAGANAGKTAFKTKETAKKPEGSTTDGSLPVAKASVLKANSGK